MYTSELYSNLGRVRSFVNDPLLLLGWICSAKLSSIYNKTNLCLILIYPKTTVLDMNTDIHNQCRKKLDYISQLLRFQQD